MTNPSTPLPTSERQAIARRHLEMENAYRLQETLDTLTPDCVFEDMALGERVQGHPAAAAYYQRWWKGFPDLTWVPQRRAFTEDGVVSELIVRGTHRGDYLGIAPTGNIDPERRYPSMFEPIHGSAFDIMGKGLANPVGTFWSVVMLLEHLGEADAAARVMRAIESATANPALHTRDLGGSATTADVTRAVCEALSA